MPPATETQKVSKEPAKTPTKNLGPRQLQRTTRNTKHYTELIDQKDNLWKMEYKLKRTVNLRPQNTVWQTAVKKLTDLLPVDIYYIGTIGFYWNLVQPDTITFITSLYKIDQIIEEKETLAQEEDKLTDEELVEQKLPH